MFAYRRSTSVRGSLAFLLALPIAVFGSSPLLAQDDTDSVALDDEPLEEIIVTGSRLARTGFDTPSPVVVIGDPEMRGNTSPSICKPSGRGPWSSSAWSFRISKSLRR